MIYKMLKKMVKTDERGDYEKKSFSPYCRIKQVDEKVMMVMMGSLQQFCSTVLCYINTLLRRTLYTVLVLVIIYFLGTNGENITLQNGIQLLISDVTDATNQTSVHANTNDSNQNHVSIIFGGDVSLGEPIRKGNGTLCDYCTLMANLSSYFKESDFNVVNIEAPFATREMRSGRTTNSPLGIYRKAWTESVAVLVAGNIKGASMSNKHITDYGDAGVIYTQKVLESNNITSIGISYGERYPFLPQIPTIKELNGIRFAFLSYCGQPCEMERLGNNVGPALVNKRMIAKDIEAINKLTPKVNFKIVCLHWGRKYMAIPDESSRELAIYLNKLGVDLIVGTHSHVLQGHEWINGTFVHYSLGNLLYHPHHTAIGYTGRVYEEQIAERELNRSNISRGPTMYSELLRIQFSSKQIESAEYLPIRIHVDPQTHCLYPKTRAATKGVWQEVCGPQDENCYYPRQDNAPEINIYGDEINNSEEVIQNPN